MKYCVIGRHGLIGGSLARKLGEVTSFPTPDTQVLFHFGSYTHLDFEQNPEYHMKQTLDSYTQLLPYCRERGILFVYPSSALVYEKDTQFSRFKKALEQLVSCYDTSTLGLRIFPVYGPGESRTVISQWCRQMLAGERPVVYGRGEQWRDFVYVDDVVEQILQLVAMLDAARPHVVLDIGSGVGTTFNRIVEIINQELSSTLVPKYVSCPQGYSKGIICEKPLFAPKVSIEEGICKVLTHMASHSMRERQECYAS